MSHTEQQFSMLIKSMRRLMTIRYFHKNVIYIHTYTVYSYISSVQCIKDTNFSWDDMAFKVNNELLNDLGNFVNRYTL